MKKYQKIGTIVGALIGFAVVVAIRWQHYVPGLKFLALIFILLGAWIGSLFDNYFNKDA